MQNELLISYQMVAGANCDIVSYTVTDSKNDLLQQKECSHWSVRNWGIPNSWMFECNMAVDILMSLGIYDLDKVEIERSMSTLGNRLIWVRY